MTTNSNVATAAASTITVEGLAELEAKTQELKELKRARKVREEQEVWEAKTKARNPQYVMGSLRQGQPGDEEHVKHVHGWVCEIVCAECGETRIINKQDAFQVRFCKVHKDEARKAASKAKRLEKKVAGKSVEEIQAEIDALNAQLGPSEADAQAEVEHQEEMVAELDADNE